MKVLMSIRQDKNSYGSNIDVIEHEYIEYLQNFGISIVIVPNKTNKIQWSNINGVIISGGNDIDPSSYGGKIIESLSISPERDDIEKKLIEGAIFRGLPLLGICRGMQMLNVFFNVKISLLNNHPPAKDHLIKFVKFQEKLGKNVTVNSYHNYGILIEDLSKELLPLAKNESEEIIEALYHPYLPVAGVQWHPERKSLNKELNEKLIKAFVNKELFWEIKK